MLSLTEGAPFWRQAMNHTLEITVDYVIRRTTNT